MHQALKPIIPLEYDECVALVQWMTLKNIKFSHIHQEMYTTSWKQKTKAKNLGVVSGVPDYIIMLPKTLLFIEMKRKGGKVKDSQAEWIKGLNCYEGVEACVCWSFPEAMQKIEEIMGRDRKLSQSEINSL
jgi:hypothetical protein